MLLRENPYFAILCITAVVSGCVAFTAWLRRELAPATRPFTGLMVAIAAYAAAAAIGAASARPEGIVFWVTMEAVCSSIVTALFFSFTLHFTHRGYWLNRWRRGVIWTMPLLNAGLALSNPWHRLVWTSFTPVASGQVIFHQGPGYLWLAAWFYIYVLTGSLLVARLAMESPSIYRQQAITVIASTAPPLISGTLHVLDLVPPGVSLLPISFLFTGLIYFTSLLRFRLFDVLPIARDTLIENMAESVLVIDNEGRVIDLNPAARQFAQRISSDSFWETLPPLLGLPIEQVLDRWPSLLRHCQSARDTEVLITIAQQPPLHINLHLKILGDRQPTGKLIVIRDVSAHYQAELELKQINQVLESRLLENEALQDQLKEQAIRDGLTGLCNRRYFEEALQAEFVKAQRANMPLAIILVDIDHFKRVNDTYGHQAGDCVLQVFANVIREHIRTSDIACRYGGEEFILAMPGMSLAEAYQRAEAVRMALRETIIQFKECEICVTISGGVGALPEYSGNPDGLVMIIDKALYRAKAAGRDRIHLAQLEQSSPFPQPASPQDTMQPAAQYSLASRDEGY
jgi:diguanylate cyclase (GGDEF)-like protein